MSLPKGWRLIRIGDACRLVNGRAFKPSDWSTSGLPIVRIQNLNNHQAAFNRFSGHVDPKFLIEDNELLFAWSGTPGTSFGAHIWTRGRAILNQHIFRVLDYQERFDRTFLKHAINDRLAHLIGEAHGGAGLAHVTKPRFEATEIVLPPIDEQRRIVAKLDALQARSRRARAALDAIPPLLDKLRQSILAAAFRGDLTKEWRAQHPNQEPAHLLLQRIRTERRAKWEQAELQKLLAKGKPPKDDAWKAKYQEPKSVDPAGLPELPEGWCWASLDEVARLVTGGTPPGKEEGTYGGDVPFIKPTDLDAGRHVLTARQYLTGHGASFLEVVPAGTTLITSIGATIGKSGMASVACATNQQINAAVPVCVDPVFLYWVARSPAAQRWILDNASATTLPIINKGRLAGLPVPVGPPDEQAAISALLDERMAATGRAPTAVEQALDTMTSLDRAILAKAFAGS